MKTVELNGKVYQLNKTYVTKGGQIVVLTGLNKNQFHCIIDVFTKDSANIITLLTSEYTSGTIEVAQMKLEHGQWYAIKAHNQDDTCAMWNSKKRMYTAHTTEFNPSFWSPMFKMVKES